MGADSVLYSRMQSHGRGKLCSMLKEAASPLCSVT